MMKKIAVFCAAAFTLAAYALGYAGESLVTPEQTDAVFKRISRKERNRIIESYWDNDIFYSALAGDDAMQKYTASFIPVMRKWDKNFVLHYNAVMKVLNMKLNESGFAYGFNPILGMIWKLQYEATHDSTQIPVGKWGVKPFGKTPDGRPVFEEMPVYCEVPEAFVAYICYPGLDPNLPSLPIPTNIPAEGPAREEFKRKIIEDFRACQAASVQYRISDEKRLEDLAAEKRELEWRDKERKILDDMHEQELAHVEKMTPAQYRRVKAENLERVRNGLEYTDLFYNKKGEIFKVDVNGNMTKWRK